MSSFPLIEDCLLIEISGSYLNQCLEKIGKKKKKECTNDSIKFNHSSMCAVQFPKRNFEQRCNGTKNGSPGNVDREGS